MRERGLAKPGQRGLENFGPAKQGEKGQTGEPKREAKTSTKETKARPSEAKKKPRDTKKRPRNPKERPRVRQGKAKGRPKETKAGQTRLKTKTA